MHVHETVDQTHLVSGRTGGVARDVAQTAVVVDEAHALGARGSERVGSSEVGGREGEELRALGLASYFCKSANTSATKKKRKAYIRHRGLRTRT